MKAIIDSTDQVIEGISLSDLRGQMMRMLSISGPRGLTATTTTGTVIHVELYDGQDYIMTKDGRTINPAAI